MKRHRWQGTSGSVRSIVSGFCLLALGLLLLWWAPKLAYGGKPGITVGFASLVSLTASVVQVGRGGAQFLAWWRKSTGPSTGPTPTDIDTAKDILGGLVLEQWTEETVLRSLADPEPIPVPWRSTEHEELMDRPQLIAKGAVAFPSLSGHITNMANDFRALRCRRLVILGGPGTGKTTLAVQLLIELLRTRLADEPVPVLLSAARWDTKAHPQIRDWLAKCLDMDYPALCAEGMPPNTSRTLVNRGGVLPILDGLDELPGDARADMLAALNRSMSENDQLILTCRTAQFAESVEAVGDVLTAAAVIEPRPLSPGAAADYLEACLPPRLPGAWPQVLNALREGTAPALAEVTSTPLGLWLVRVTYVMPRRDPSPLLDLGRGDAPQLRDHLCDRLIPALVSSRPPADNPVQPFRPHHSWNPDHVQRWLAYLARQLTLSGEDTNSVAWWHFARHTPTGVIRIAVSVGYGLVVGLAIGVLMKAPGVGTVMGLLTGSLVMLTTGPWFRQSPGHADFGVHGKRPLFLQTLMEALTIGLMGAVVGWLTSQGRPGYAMTIGLASGLGFLCVVGVPRWLEYPTATTTARSPRSTWQADRNLTLIRVLLTAIVVALMAGIVAWQAKLSLVTALVGGSLLGLLFGLVVGHHHAWLAYSLSVLRLASRGVLPLRAMGFLEDAHRLGLLRAEGPFYQFRHVELQKHLSAAHRADSGNPPQG
jgi:hypothetical protein